MSLIKSLAGIGCLVAVLFLFASVCSASPHVGVRSSPVSEDLPVVVTAPDMSEGSDAGSHNMADRAEGSSYLNYGASVTVPVGATEVRAKWNGLLSTGWTANRCSGTTGPYCSLTALDAAHLYEVGFLGNVTVTNLPVGGSVSLVVKKNGQTYWTLPMTSGVQGWNYQYKASQYWSSGDVIDVWWTAPAGTTFTPGIYLRPFDMLYLLCTETTARRDIGENPVDLETLALLHD